MTNYLFILVFIFLQQEGHYERHNTSCGGSNGPDMKWTLDLKPTNGYILSITKRTNNYLKSPKETTIIGYWRSEGDTLRLYQYDDKAKPLVFYQKKSKLIFQKRLLTRKEEDLLCLDYLEKRFQ